MYDANPQLDRARQALEVRGLLKELSVVLLRISGVRLNVVLLCKLKAQVGLAKLMNWPDEEALEVDMSWRPDGRGCPARPARTRYLVEPVARLGVRPSS